MRCSNCSFEVSPGADFCPLCGQEVKQEINAAPGGGEELIKAPPAFDVPAPVAFNNTETPSVSGDFREMRANKKYMNRDCPVCMNNIFFGDDIAVCSKCDLAYHKDCLPAEGCTSEKCSGSSQAAFAPKSAALIGPDEKFCNMCGKPIKKIAIKCKYCGSVVDAELRRRKEANRAPKNEGKNAMIMGILSIFLSFTWVFTWVGLVLGILAIVNGKNAKKDEEQAKQGNIGYICGIITVVIVIMLGSLMVIGGCLSAFD